MKMLECFFTAIKSFAYINAKFCFVGCFVQTLSSLITWFSPIIAEVNLSALSFSFGPHTYVCLRRIKTKLLGFSFQLFSYSLIHWYMKCCVTHNSKYIESI